MAAENVIFMYFIYQYIDANRKLISFTLKK